MKQNILFVMLGILLAAGSWSCSDKDNDVNISANDNGGVIKGDKIVFGRGDNSWEMPYEPVELEDLPEFVLDEFRKDNMNIMDAVYEGTWDGVNGYMVQTWSEYIIHCSTLYAGAFYSYDGTSYGLIRYDSFYLGGGWNGWKCIFYWRPFAEDFETDENWDSEEYLMSLETYRKLQNL